MVASSSDAALAQVLGKRKPKTTRGRRIVKRREPQIIEDAKSALIIAGNKTSNDVQVFLRDLYRLRQPLAQLYMKRHDQHPFEDATRLEQLCAQNGHSLFAFGSSSKKRPFRVILGRLFDSKLLDMLEFGVKDFKSIQSFEAKQREAVVGSKPLVVFQGAAFETSETLKRAKSLLLDFFGGATPDKVLLSGLDQVVVCSTFDSASAGATAADVEPSVSVRRFALRQLKSGSKVPRVELVETGPRFVLSVDRCKMPDKDRWKQAIKVPKAAKPSKVKNVSKDEMGKRSGRIHLGKQNFDQIHTVHHGQAKRRKVAASDAAAAGAEKKPAGSSEVAP
jgi:ribosome production factor 2